MERVSWVVSLREKLGNVRLIHTWQTRQERGVRSVGLRQIVKIECSEKDECSESRGGEFYSFVLGSGGVGEEIAYRVAI